MQTPLAAGGKISLQTAPAATQDFHEVETRRFPLWYLPGGFEAAPGLS
jgi:hypothetical protein